MIADRENAKFKTFQDRPLDFNPRESALIRGKKFLVFLRASSKPNRPANLIRGEVLAFSNF